MPAGVNWRFRVPDGEEIAFDDLHQGPQRFVAGEDFGDFVIWRRDDVPAYQLAVVADDAAMQITEVVRGADLLKSTARQLLLIRALGLPVPAYYHCDLVRDEAGAAAGQAPRRAQPAHAARAGMQPAAGTGYVRSARNCDCVKPPEQGIVSPQHRRVKRCE